MFLGDQGWESLSFPWLKVSVKLCIIAKVMEVVPLLTLVSCCFELPALLLMSWGTANLGS